MRPEKGDCSKSQKGLPEPCLDPRLDKTHYVKDPWLHRPDSSVSRGDHTGGILDVTPRFAHSSSKSARMRGSSSSYSI